MGETGAEKTGKEAGSKTEVREHLRPARGPGVSGPGAEVLRLQNLAGNRAVSRLLEPPPGAGRMLPAGWTMSRPGDRSEVEAQEQSLRAGDDLTRHQGQGDQDVTLPLGKVPAAALSQPRLPSLPSHLAAGLGPGRELPQGLRSSLEEHWGVNLADVRLHTGPQAEVLADRWEARAFTLGPHVVFGAGSWAPETGAGKQLLAHELAHVLQQARKPGLYREAVKPTLKPGFHVFRDPRGVLIVGDVWQEGDSVKGFLRRALSKYLRWRFGAMSPELFGELLRTLEGANIEYFQSEADAQAGKMYGLDIFPDVEARVVSLHARRTRAAAAAAPKPEPAGAETTAPPKEGETPPPAVVAGEEKGKPKEGGKPAETGAGVPPEVRDFYTGSGVPEGQRLPVADLIRMHEVFTRYVKGQPRWGPEGQSFKDFADFLDKNAKRLRGQLDLSERGKLDLQVLESLIKKLEAGQTLEFPEAEEKALAAKAQAVKQKEGAAPVTARPEWLLLPAEDRKLLLEMMEKHPDLFADAAGGTEMRRVTSDVKQGMALRISVPYMPAEVGSALVSIVTDPGFWLQMGLLLAIYVGLWLAPEPFSKIASTALTTFLLLYFGWDTIISFARAWSKLSDACRFDAQTGAKLEEAAKGFARDLGPLGANILLAIAMWMIGRAGGKVLKGAAAEKGLPPGEIKAPPVEATGAKPALPEAKPSVPEAKPAVAEAKPTIPEAKPTIPEAKPTVPEVKPTVLPEAKPVIPEAKPAIPEAKPAPPEPALELEPTAHPKAGEVKPRRPRGFEPTAQGTGKRVKAGTLEDLEPTAQKPAPRPRKRSVTREQQLEGIEAEPPSKAARAEFDKVRDSHAEKLGVGEGGEVHHAIELQALDRYPGAYTAGELNALGNMRGIPPELVGKKQLHQAKIREIWDRHYNLLDQKIAELGLKPGTAEYVNLVRNFLRQGAKEIDYVLGQFFSESRKAMEWKKSE